MRKKHEMREWKQKEGVTEENKAKEKQIKGEGEK